MSLIKLLKNKYLLLFFIYIVALVLFAIFSYKLIFHDTWEYILATKLLAGYLNKNVYTSHGMLYPFFISLFVRYLPSILTMRMVNISWIVLIGVLLYSSGLRKTAFLIWVFSPIAWIWTIIISPFVPVSFFLLVAYLSIMKWQKDKKLLYFIISALALGLTAAIHTIFIILVIFFILAFFYDKKLKETLFYSLFACLSFSLSLILDACLFILTIRDKVLPFPFYSLVRFFGGRSVIQLGLHTEAVKAVSLQGLLYNLFIISPLLFYLYKISFRKNKPIVIFLILSTILFSIQGSTSYMYSITLAPIVIILLSRTFGKKELLLHILISSVIIFVMVAPYFVPDKQEIKKRNMILEDLTTINKDFSFDAVIFDTKTMAVFYIWDKNSPYIVPIDEYNSVLQNKLYPLYYAFEIKSSEISNDKVLEINVGLRINVKKDLDYENLPFLLEKGEEPPEGHKLTKCYQVLCVYKKSKIL